MRGYWEDAERTREAFAGPFLRTGDLGFLKDGYVYICGRSKEVVIVNGRNYYPQDMEWEASKIAGVRKGNVVAFGARDPSGVERDRARLLGRRPQEVLHQLAGLRRERHAQVLRRVELLPVALAREGEHAVLEFGDGRCGVG